MKVIVPPGEYVLGDPCYCFSHETSTWDDILESNNVFETPMIEFKDGIVLGFFTYYGDGEYFDQFGQSYGVDAGLIGLVSLNLLEVDRTQSPQDDGRIITFLDPTECSETDGRLRFGPFVINTREEDD